MTVTNTVIPAILGTPRVGQTISTTNGQWTYSLDYLTYAYKWKRCDALGSSCVDIGGAVSSSYGVTSADLGSTIRAEVTATEHAGTAPEPSPIAGQGYSIVFQDDFDTFDASFWRRSIWYEPEATNSDVFVSNSVLNLLSQSSQGFPGRWAMTRTQAWQYGYFECKMRYTNQAAAFPAFWMMSDNWMNTGNCSVLKISEFDMFEAFQTNFPRSHSGALHQNTTGQCGLADQVNSNSWTNDVGFDLGSNWRIYSGLWTPTNVYWYVDEVLLKSTPVWSTTNQPMRVIFQIDNHGGATGTELRAEIDWFRVWQQ